MGWLVGRAAYHYVKQGLAAYNKRKRRDEPRTVNGQGLSILSLAPR